MKFNLYCCNYGYWYNYNYLSDLVEESVKLEFGQTYIIFENYTELQLVTQISFSVME